MEVLTLPSRSCDPTFVTPEVTMLCGPGEPGLQAVVWLLVPGRAMIDCRVGDDDPWCRWHRVEGSPRDTVARLLSHEPSGRRPTKLLAECADTGVRTPTAAGG